MKPSVYVETTIFSDLTARPTNNLSATVRHQTTRIWWQNDANHFSLFASAAVRSECAEGDPEMAKKRLAYIDSLTCLPSTAEALALGDRMIAMRLLPVKAKIDALHLSIATLNKISFLATWNCRHLANGQIFRQIERFLRQSGYTVPIVCTPNQLPGADHA